MDQPKTKWDQLQDRFKNSWIGLTVLGLTALAVALSQLSDSAKKLVEWLRPTPVVNISAPVADVLVPAVLIEPLQHYRELAKLAGSEAIYPGGAVIRFNASQNGNGDDPISIDGLNLMVSSDDPQKPCPFKRTVDGYRGGGVGSFLRQFDVHVNGGKIEAVQRVEGPDTPPRRGDSENLLDLGSVLPIVLRKGEDPEIIIIRIAARDDGRYRYRAGLSMRYTNRTGLKTKDLGSVSFCMTVE